MPRSAPVIDKRHLVHSRLEPPPTLRYPAADNVPRNAPQMPAVKPKAYSYVRGSARRTKPKETATAGKPRRPVSMRRPTTWNWTAN
jgi:hypothetical protein